MDTLDYIVKKFNIDVTEPSPFLLPIGRFKDIPKLFQELGFKVGAEVGVYQGNYSHFLLKRGFKLYGIDAWETYPGYKDQIANDVADAYVIAQENVKGRDCILIKGYSADVVKQFEDESLDFVFIDGNHIFEYVVEDIALWSKKVRKGGIVYGHDFRDFSNTSRWKDMSVIPAVEGWTKAHKIHPWFVTTQHKDPCWMYVK